MGENEETEIIPGTPKDVAGLRKALISMVTSGKNLGATRYADANGSPYQLNAGTNPMQTTGATTISNLLGRGNYIPNTKVQFANPVWSSMSSTATGGMMGRGITNLFPGLIPNQAPIRFRPGRNPAQALSRNRFGGTWPRLTETRTCLLNSQF
jgi:hypothetical protein